MKSSNKLDRTKAPEKATGRIDRLSETTSQSRVQALIAAACVKGEFETEIGAADGKLI
jgi:hypothetical protein